jgi:DNA-binding PadR family transcriptional regulator
MHRHLARFFRANDDLGVPGGRFFGPGKTRLARLSLLGEQASHGCELMTKLEERCGAVYQASAGASYPTLQQLEDQGLARAQRADGKKVYAITPDGERELARNREAVERVWRRAGSWSEWREAGQPEVAEIVGPALRLMKAALKASAKAHGDTATLRRLRDILEDAHREIEQLGRRRR